MRRPKEIHAYLAGPDVFFSNAVVISEEKKAKLAAVGIIGHFPLDNQITVSAFDDPQQTAHAIAKANEQLMMDCCAKNRMGIILANMTPFHGPSMDVGTAFEVGFMSALAATQDNILIIGYTDDARLFEDRVAEELYGGKEHLRQKEGLLYSADGTMIEAFGGADNLMITHAIEKTGGKIVLSFDAAVALAKEWAEQQSA